MGGARDDAVWRPRQSPDTIHTHTTTQNSRAGVSGARVAPAVRPVQVSSDAAGQGIGKGAKREALAGVRRPPHRGGGAAQPFRRACGPLFTRKLGEEAELDELCQPCSSAIWPRARGCVCVLPPAHSRRTAGGAAGGGG